MATSVIKLKAKPGMEAALSELMRRMVEVSNANETGIRFFQGFRSGAPDEFYMIESFKDMDERAAHLASDHFKALRRELIGYVEGAPEVLRLTDL